MGLQLNDVTNFFNKLQSYTINNDGILNQKEAESAYNQMLSNDPNNIPQQIKDKFANGGLNSDAFNSIDPLGMKDGFINDQELFKYVSGDSGFKPWTPPAGSQPGPNFANAGYLVNNSNGNPDAEASSKALIKDVGGILGVANDGQVPDDQLSKGEIDHAITLIQANTGTVDHADGKAKLLENLYQNFDANSQNGYITSDSLAKTLKMAPAASGNGWS